MIDFHSHILPNLDDGSKSIDETFNLLEEAQNAGFSSIICTTHYMENYYEENEDEREAWIYAIQDKMHLKNLNLNLYVGSEIYITNNIVNLIKCKSASTLNHTRYVLFELPMNNKAMNLIDVIYLLLQNNYIPIIAHPERYEYVQENPNMLIELIQMGALFQGNFASIIGTYGKKAEKTIKLLLKNNMIHFLGSDVHRQKSIYRKMPEILNEISKILDEEQINKLTKLNAKCVLENKKIEIDEPIKIKRKFGINF